MEEAAARAVEQARNAIQAGEAGEALTGTTLCCLAFAALFNDDAGGTPESADTPAGVMAGAAAECMSTGWWASQVSLSFTHSAG